MLIYVFHSGFTPCIKSCSNVINCYVGSVNFKEMLKNTFTNLIKRIKIKILH